jgi:hypothetical protein
MIDVDVGFCAARIGVWLMHDDFSPVVGCWTRDQTSPLLLSWKFSAGFAATFTKGSSSLSIASLRTIDRSLKLEGGGAVQAKPSEQHCCEREQQAIPQKMTMPE